MAAKSQITTIQELLELPEDGMRHEMLEGIHVVTPAPRYAHQRALLVLLTALQKAISGSVDLEVLLSPADIVLATDTLVQPDVFVIRRPASGTAATWAEVGLPLIAVEIQSPSTASRDRGAKRRIYQKAGIEEYWIVDLDARLVERWTPADIKPEIVHEQLVFSVGDVKGTIDVAALFTQVG